MFMSFKRTDVAVDKLASDMHKKMQSIVKEGVYDKPETPNYVRTGDLLSSIQKRVEKSGSGLSKEYRIKVYFDTGLIRPIRAIFPGYFNHHMTGTNLDENPQDVSDVLPEWYDKGFDRNGKKIKLDILKKTKEAFPPEKVKEIVMEDLKSAITEGLQKYKK